MRQFQSFAVWSVFDRLFVYTRLENLDLLTKYLCPATQYSEWAQKVASECYQMHTTQVGIFYLRLEFEFF